MEKQKIFLHTKGVTYFDGKTERVFFFVATIIMLIWGLFAGLGGY